jgi:hypothetical protein
VGEVQVFAAMGSHAQVVRWLGRGVGSIVRDEAVPELMSPMDDRNPMLKHHTFEVCVRRASGLSCFQGLQTACFVQFRFPESPPTRGRSRRVIEDARSKQQPIRTPLVLAQESARFEARSVHTISLGADVRSRLLWPCSVGTFEWR